MQSVHLDTQVWSKASGMFANVYIVGFNGKRSIMYIRPLKEKYSRVSALPRTA